jgi:hypothetical protein
MRSIWRMPVGPGAAIHGLKEEAAANVFAAAILLELPLLAVVVEAEVGDEVFAHDVAEGVF